MKLYYSPGSCAMAVHIVANEAGLGLETEKVDIKAKKTASGADFLTVSPNGFVPVLVLDNGEQLTEAVVLVEYLSDLAPQAGLMPEPGSFERYRAKEMLSFLSSEVHKYYSPFFNPMLSDDAKAVFGQRLAQRLAYLDKHLEGKDFLVAGHFTPADAYLFVMLNWTRFTTVDLAQFANLTRFHAALAQRPAVQKTLKEEGLA